MKATLQQIISLYSDTLYILYYSQLHTGNTNLVYKVELSDGQSVVVKIFLNLKRESEKLIVKSIDFPKVLYSSDKCRVEELILFEEVQYMRDGLIIVDAIKKYNLLKIDGIQNFSTLFTQYTSDPLCLQIVSRFGEIKEEALIHFDLYTSNMMKVGDTIHLIDFEFSFKGETTIDLANLFEEAATDYTHPDFYREDLEYSDPYKEDLIRRYYGECNSKEILKEVEDRRKICNFFYFLWALNSIKSKTNRGSMNYHKYAEIKLNRCHTLHLICTSEYESLLALLQ